MELFESGLFMELGEVVGHDPDMYEDIPKQPLFNTTSSANINNQFDEWTEKSQFMGMESLEQTFLPAEDGQYLDGLIAEGNQLIDQLIAANGVDWSSDYIDLEAIDELDFAAKSAGLVSDDVYMYGEQGQGRHLLPDLDTFSPDSKLDTEYPIVDSPLSTVSTLPSEPASPLDISAWQMQEELPQELLGTANSDLTNLLQSLSDEPAVTAVTDSDTSLAVLYEDPFSQQAHAGTESDESYHQYSILSPSDTSLTDTSLTDTAGSVSGESPAKTKTSKKKKKSTPYSKLPPSRKERKKQQNKEAAIRYREKKRTEAQSAQSEEEVLAQRNTQLKTEVVNLEREILCMKELLSDVFNIHSL